MLTIPSFVSLLDHVNGCATEDSAVTPNEACIRDVRRWMIFEKLKVKDKKTEFIRIDFRAQLKKVEIDNIAERDSFISTSKDAIRN